MASADLTLPAESLAIDAALKELPNRPAVFLLWPHEGKPYLARTNVLRRRLVRLLGTRDKPSRLLNLRGTIARVEYRFTGSRLEAQFLLWEWAQRHLGSGYRKEIRLRLPPYLKLVLSNEFPRTQVTTHIGRSQAIYFGPFRNRASASRFESEFLDLFQLRRCQEDLAPAADHAGCMYGEMGRCLRPCQQAVGVEEYRAEAMRVAEFLRTAGRSLVEPARAARERLSTELDFEGAAMMHERLQRIDEVMGLNDEMSRELSRLHAVAVAPSAEAESVEVGWLRGGIWHGFTRLDFRLADGQSVSLDARLRQALAGLQARTPSSTERMEQLAILSRWFYSSWRDGEMVLVDDWEKIPWRKMVNAVSRVASLGKTGPGL